MTVGSVFRLGWTTVCREGSRRLSVEKTAAGCSRSWRFGRLVGVRCRMKDARLGQVLPVKDDYHYPCPPGLCGGDLVRIVAFDHGYWTVEKDGQQFLVFMCCV